MSQIATMEARPPYVVFELRGVEDRTKTIETGRYTVKDVPFAVITPQGSKDRIERVAEEWFEYLDQQVRENRFPDSWLTQYKQLFKAWQDGLEMVVEGTDLRNWPGISPAQLSALRSANLRTVEDVAGANEEGLRRIGMGGRALKTRAEGWIASIEGPGKASERLAGIEAENADLRLRNDSLEEQLKDLSSKVESVLAERGGNKQAASPRKL